VVVAGLFFDPAVASGEVSREQAAQALATLERGWVENAGQWDERAAFSAPGYFRTTWVTKEGELRHVASKRVDCEQQTPEAGEPESAGRRFRKPCPAQSWVVSERWVGGEVKGIRGEDELETKVSYFLGNDPAKHRSGLPSYRFVSLGEVWPGVEVKLKASQKTVEKLFYLRAGANLAKVRVELGGANRLRLSQEGELVIETGLGELKFSKPVAWQEKDGQKLPVQASYRLFGKNRYGFAVQGADPSLPLVIDPILQSTYLGGSDDEQAYALAIGPAPNYDVYVAGYTSSANFPNTAGGAQANHGGGFYDAFVARLNSSLTSILQSTYLGGSGRDYAYELAIAGSGDVYVAGFTSSTNFPNTFLGAQASNSGGISDAFVARLDASLTSNPQSTYLGGGGDDGATALAIAGSGEVCVAGYTSSTNFPNTTGGAQASNGGGTFDAFVARLDSSLTFFLLPTTYLGGSGDDEAWALAIGPAPNYDVYVAGWTNSTDFPNTNNGAQASSGGFDDAFVARLNASLTSNPQSTYLGGSGNDYATALTIAGSGAVYVAGYTGSSNFPNTTGGAQATNNGSYDAFAARLNAALTSNPQSSYLGGSGDDLAQALAIGPAPNYEVYVAGYTLSTDFPNTAGGAHASYGGGFYDAFVARLNATLTSNPQSTYLGGSADDEAYALAIAASGDVYVAGLTDSTDFPNTAGGAQASNGGSYDAFVARLTADLAGAAATTDMVANAPTVPPSLAPGGSYSLSFSCTNAGSSAATNATCSIAASSGSVSGVSCTPSVPVLSLAAGASITCTYTFTAPGTQGGGNTPETGVTFTVTAGAANDSNGANNTASNAGGPVPLVDALDDAVSLPANTSGATFNLGSNDQVGAGSPPVGSTFTYQGGSCAGASVNSTGVATFNVPASGTCTVQYQLCYNQACDTATLTVTAQPVVLSIPTLNRWGLLALLAFLGSAGVLLLRRVVA
jgi:hypothetical protein